MDSNKIKSFFKNIFNGDSESVYGGILTALAFLLPIFAIPFAFNAFEFSKAFLLYIGVSLCAIFWLIGVLKKGELEIPKSAPLLAFLGVTAVWFFSFLFSSNKVLSFFGAGYETRTFVFIFFLFLVLFLSTLAFRSERKAIVFYLLFFFSSALVFIFQIFQLFGEKFGLSIAKWDIFQSPISNLIGGWNEFAVFFGFVGLISLSMLELMKLNKTRKFFLWAVLVFSLLAMIAVNFISAWILFGSFVFICFVYLLSVSLLNSNDISKNSEKKFFRPAFFVIIVVLFVILGRSFISNLTVLINTDSIEVRPSWSSTHHVAKETLKENLWLGSGPNTFLYDWMKFKPQSINSTSFRNARFESGIGTLPSFTAETGLLGGVSLIVLLLSIVAFNGVKTLSQTQDNSRSALIMASFLGSLYLWISVIIYSPGPLIFIFAVLTTGITSALLIGDKKTGIIKIQLFKGAKSGFVSVLSVAVLIMFFVSISYLFLQKYWAEHLFSQSVRMFSLERNIAEAESGISGALKLNKQDRYYRTLSEINLIKIQEVLSGGDVSQDYIKSQFPKILNSAISNAKMSIDINPLDSLNWAQMGRVYESVMPLGIQGSADAAIGFYAEALRRSPGNLEIINTIKNLNAYKAGLEK